MMQLVPMEFQAQQQWILPIPTETQRPCTSSMPARDAQIKMSRY